MMLKRDMAEKPSYEKPAGSPESGVGQSMATTDRRFLRSRSTEGWVCGTDDGQHVLSVLWVLRELMK